MNLSPDNNGAPTQSDTNSLPPLFMPKILTKFWDNNNQNDSWTIHFYEEFSSIFVDPQADTLDEAIKQQFQRYIDQNFSDFRMQIEIKAVSLLVGFFYKEKEIRIYTPRLSQELFLIQEIERDQSATNKNADYGKLKSHTEKVASLLPAEFPSSIETLTKTYDLPDLLYDKKFEEIDVLEKEITEELIGKVTEYRSSLFERFTDWGLGLTANFTLFRINILKFLAILPSLDFDQSGNEVKRILLESFRRLLEDHDKACKLKKTGQDRPLPISVKFLCQICFYMASFLPAGPLAWLVRHFVRFMAKRFIAGETIETANKCLFNLFNTKRDVTLDQLGELVVSEKEADHYRDEVIKLIKGFSLHVKKGEKNTAGINKAHVSIKVSALCSDFKPYAPEYTHSLVGPRLREILLAAKQEDVFINVDSEHYDYRDIVLYVYRRVLLETPELKGWKGTGIVLQAYLRDAYRHYLDILDLAKTRNVPMPIRIVKGAYWDAETISADAHSLDAPQFMNKEETDLHFRQLIVKILEDHPHVQLVVASHNFSDHAFSEAVRNKLYPSTAVIEHQCLDMTYEALSTGMAELGWPVRNYVPIGCLLVGMAYLVRRIMENSSQVGVLTIMRSHRNYHTLRGPKDVHLEKKGKGELSRDLTITHLTRNFFNVAPVKIYLEWERTWVLQSLEDFKNNHLGKTYNNSFPHSGPWHDVFSSSDTDILVGKIQYATVEDTQSAIELADKAYNSGVWAKSSPSFRSSVLVKAANIMLAKRNTLACLISYEAGKTLTEALADVDEAVDFLNFYAREEIRLNKENPNLISRGIVAVISPWNFPIAIPCGMTVSALVAGNAVILKSASWTPLIAQEMVEILHAAGVPKDILIHMVGRGSTVGDVIVKHDKVAGMVFTGSKEVGMSIAHKMGKRIIHNQLFDVKFPVKVITEMGGKNAIIVTANAELDETVTGILYSAFGHSGQKCSAASRLIVSNKIKDRLIERLKEACNDLQVGKAFDLSTTVNPVISNKDKERLQQAVKKSVQEVQAFGGQVVVDRSSEQHPGYCIGPVIIEVPNSRATHTESYAMNELFGPVVHLVGFDDLPEALKIFNATEYALTGGVFSQSQDDIDYLTARMESGNIYINRAITGARVAIEPFGGFKLSGTGPKAGGVDYINSFHLCNSPTTCTHFAESTLQDERGSDYHFYLARPSKLGFKGRQERVERALNKLILHFETLFKGVYGDNKDLLIDYKNWLNKNFYSFQMEHHPNRNIPGQLSYCDFSMVQEHAVILAFNERPPFKTFMQFVCAITMGVGVTVITRNEKSFAWWVSVKNYFLQSGISKENFEVYFSTESLMEKVLREPYLSSIIVDGDMDKIQRVLNTVYDTPGQQKRMTNIITPFTSYQIGDFESYLKQYIWIRAFAVNTMRHGAPMSMEQ